MDNQQSIPESLTIAVEKRHHRKVIDWWSRLTDGDRADFLTVASLSPEQIATQPQAVDADADTDAGDDEPSEWYEYIVNQDVRFYFDRSDPQGNYNIVSPILTPISNVADIEVVSHLLTNPRRQRDG